MDKYTNLELTWLVDTTLISKNGQMTILNRQKKYIMKVNTNFSLNILMISII